MGGLRFLLVGDVVGRPGRQALLHCLNELIEEHHIDFVIANGENAAGGFGLTPKIAGSFFSSGVDVITSGNHIWRNKDVFKIIDTEKRLLRPINFPAGAPGKGYGLYEKNNIKIGVVNALGRVYMEPLDCPFRASLAAGQELKRMGAEILLLDFHAEATSEKVAMGHFLDGTFSVVFGTHTHVQTSDARILPGGTGYVTDIGMTGPCDSVIGVLKERAIKKFVSGMPAKFETAEEGVEINCAVCEIDPSSGLAVEMSVLRKKVNIDHIACHS